MGCKPVSNVIDELNLDLNEVKKVWCDVVVMENYTGSIYDAIAERLGISRTDAKYIVRAMYYIIPHHNMMMCVVRQSMASCFDKAVERYGASVETCVYASQMLKFANRDLKNARKPFINIKEI